MSEPQNLYSPARKIGELLKAEFQNDQHFYFFSPDETTSNRFDAIFDVTERAWALEKAAWDLPESENGRIVEMLSENALFSVMTGHLLNGENAMMGSYEAFFSVITSQILQQIKFFKQCNEVSWRPKYPAVNLLSTSTCWRQDHNGFTHQSPALISTLLSVPSYLVNCLFPIDDIAAEKAFHFMLRSKNVVNLTTFNKNEEPRYLDENSNEFTASDHGANLYDFVANDEEPEFIFTAAGDLVATEAIEAIKILKEDIPGIKLRFVYINALSYRAIGTVKHPLTKTEFFRLYTSDKPIIGVFHGYPETLENILENYTYRNRLRVHGFLEEGSTTTPFEMLRRNGATRYDLALDVAYNLQRTDLINKYQNILRKNQWSATLFGEDLIK